MRAILSAAAMAVVLAGCSSNGEPNGGARGDTTRSTATIVPKRENEILAALRDSFQKVNPRLENVRILASRSWYFDGPLLILGHAIVGDLVFRGDFKDEMFGVFVVDASLTRIERVVGTIPTPRWYDYDMRFGRVTWDSVEVVGQGMTYGDEPKRWAYRWVTPAKGPDKRPGYPSDSLPPAGDDYE